MEKCVQKQWSAGCAGSRWSGGVGKAVERTPARAGRKLDVGLAAGTRPEKMPCSLDGRADRSSAAAADDTQPSRRSKMTRSAWDQNLDFLLTCRSASSA